MKGYKPKINIIKDENGNLIADPQSVLNNWKNFFNRGLNLHGVHNVRQEDIHTAEPLVPEPSLVEVEIATGKLKSYKSPGTDQNPAELIKAGGKTLCSETHKLICSNVIMRNCHSSRRTLLLHHFIKRVVRLIVIIIQESLLINCLQNFIQHSPGQVNSICQ
jgi:hypothetical protein